MGGVPSCRCNKAQEGDELDMDKEKAEMAKHLNDQNMNSEIYNTNTVSNSSNKVNFSGMHNHEEEDAGGTNNRDDNAIIQSRAFNLANIDNENNGDAVPHHRKQMSNEIKMEIYEDDIITDHLNPNAQFNINGVNIGSSKSGKLYTASSGNMTGGKLPLEVINENNADVSKDSIENNNKLMRENSDGAEKEIKNIEYNDNVVIKHEEKHTEEPDNQVENQNQKFEITSDFHHNAANTFENANGRSNNNNNNFNTINYSNNKEVNEKEKLRNLQIRQIITTIIPEYRLLNCADDEVLFQSELKKLINNEITTHSSQLYSTRFCVVTKLEFRYYKSKEQFLTLQKPLFAIPFFQIAEANLIKSKISKKFDHLYIKLIETEKSNKNRPDRSKQYDNQTSNYIYHNIENRIPSMDIDNSMTHQNESSFIKAKRMTPLDQTSAHIKRGGKQNNSQLDESTLIFSWDKEDTLNKWAVVLNYFIGN